MKYTIQTAPDWIRQSHLIYSIKAFRRWSGYSLVDAKRLIEEASHIVVEFEVKTQLSYEDQRALIATHLIVKPLLESESYVETILFNLAKQVLDDKQHDLAVAEKILHLLGELKRESLI